MRSTTQKERTSHVAQPGVMLHICNDMTMTTYLILGNWTDYDNRKLASGQDPRVFDCSQQWETEYLCTRIADVYPFIKETKIVEAIVSVCTDGQQGSQRENLVHLVLQKLGIPKEEA